MEEKWIRWEPTVSGLAKKYKLESLSDNEDEFKILLSDVNDQTKKIQLFKDIMRGYRISGAGLKDAIIADLAPQYDPAFFEEWTFFKVENSKYLAWLSEQSFGITDGMGTHFSLITEDAIIDFMSAYPPKIELLENN